jgi:hypothetical protein
VGLLTLDWTLDETGTPLLFDADADGVRAADELPKSHEYAADALRLLVGRHADGRADHQRTSVNGEDYGERLVADVGAFCAQQLRVADTLRNGSGGSSGGGDGESTPQCTSDGVASILQARAPNRTRTRPLPARLSAI